MGILLTHIACVMHMVDSCVAAYVFVIYRWIWASIYWNIMLGVRQELVSVVPSSMCTLRIRPRLLHRLNCFRPIIELNKIKIYLRLLFRCRSYWVKLALYICKIFVWFKRAFWRWWPVAHQILRQNVAVWFLHICQNLLKIKFLSAFSLIIWDFLRINFGQLREHLNDKCSVILLLGTRIVWQP